MPIKFFHLDTIIVFHGSNDKISLFIWINDIVTRYQCIVISLCGFYSYPSTMNRNDTYHHINDEQLYEILTNMLLGANP